MRRVSGPAVTVAVLAAIGAPAAGDRAPVSIDARLGSAWNAPLAMRIRQPAWPTLGFRPRWNTRGFERPLYYGVRVAWHGPRGAWALDLLHHKLDMRDPPAEVRRFSISHGYNLLTVQRMHERGSWRHGVGAGIVVAHPENEVRGRRLDESRGLFRDGYYLAGPAVVALAGRGWPIGGGLRIGVEASATWSFAEVPVAGGHARVPNLAAHGALSAGWRRP